MVAKAAHANRSFLGTLDFQTRLFIAWTLFVVFCQCAGWTLSALHSLNAVGYAISLIIFFAALAFWFAKSKPFNHFNKRSLLTRFKRPFPLAFLILTALAILGGALYLPNNFDGLAYRTPRVLNWLAEGKWHWIHSHFGNLNTRGAAFEWITAPLFALTKTDRLEFLINAICFLFLPGRIFAVLTRLGVRPRVAWHWMWIYPTGYGFLLQAGSIGNDMFSALWPMAALEFALRARCTKRIEHVWLSALAAALMTASKAFNLLLLPAWGLALLPTLPLLLRRPIATLIVSAFAAAASMIPTALLNHKYCGDWTGLAAEPVRLTGAAPIFQTTVNTILVFLANFAPPIFPFTGAWDRFVAQTIPPQTATRLNEIFEADAARFRISDMQAEEAAGLGFGVTILLTSIIITQLFRRDRPKLRSFFTQRNIIALAALAGAIFYMSKSGLYAPARYLLPLCFPIIIPILALPSAAALIRRLWWRAAALATFALAAMLLILSPARPLWPALTTLKNVNANSSPLLQRAAAVYNVYRNRADLLRPIREALPPKTKIVGLFSINNPETSLWRPFGSRRVLHLRIEDSPDFTRNRGIEYAIIGPNIGFNQRILTAGDWAKTNNAEVVAHFPIQILARGQSTDWVLVRLNP